MRRIVLALAAALALAPTHVALGHVSEVPIAMAGPDAAPGATAETPKDNQYSGVPAATPGTTPIPTLIDRGHLKRGLAADPIGMTSGFYVDPNSNPATWVRNNGSDSRASRIQAAIASKPMARWFGSWSGDITSAVSSFVGAADAADKLPVLVAYNIPGRDACGGHSGGGAGSPEAYRTWISGLAAGLGNRPAIVIIEPDSLADFNCMSSSAIATRTAMIRYATEQLRDRATNTWAYLDSGNARWVPANTMAGRLDSAGLRNIHGIAINVSNYITTSETAAYGNAVNASLPGYRKPFIIDTSRNGNGSNGEWCNPAGRRIGATAQTGGGAEMLVWAKIPGDSDGSCGIGAGIPAGQFSPDLAIRLIDGR